MTLLEAAEAAPVPAAFAAVTVKTYAVPLPSPLTVSGLVVPEAVCPPGLEVMVKLVIAELPLLAGAVKLMVAWPLPAVACAPCGAPGTPV